MYIKAGQKEREKKGGFQRASWGHKDHRGDSSLPREGRCLSLGGEQSQPWPSHSSFRIWYVPTVLFDSKVGFVICYKCTMKLSNRNSPAPGTQLYLKRELGWSLFVAFLYCPSWSPDHTRVSFTDWKTLQSMEEVLVTSWAPTPMSSPHPWRCSAHPDLCSPKSMFATLTAHL